jgi:hypothetical protein
VVPVRLASAMSRVFCPLPALDAPAPCCTAAVFRQGPGSVLMPTGLPRQ